MLGFQTSDFVKLRLRGCLQKNVKEGEKRRFLGNEYPYFACLTLLGASVTSSANYVWRCATCGAESGASLPESTERLKGLDHEPAKYYRMLAYLHGMPWSEDDYDENAEA